MPLASSRARTPSRMRPSGIRSGGPPIPGVAAWPLPTRLCRLLTRSRVSAATIPAHVTAARSTRSAAWTESLFGRRYRACCEESAQHTGAISCFSDRSASRRLQYKSGSRYICNYLRQQHGVPVCQYIPTNPVDAEVVAAFFKALAPAELEAFTQAMAVRRAADEAALKAQAQQVERLRYRAALAERQFDQVDPDNRLVAAELERRWEETLRDLRQAEAALADAAPDEGRVVPFGLGPDLQAAFTEV